MSLPSKMGGANLGVPGAEREQTMVTLILNALTNGLTKRLTMP
jgi:hypothetical protein